VLGPGQGGQVAGAEAAILAETIFGFDDQGDDAHVEEPDSERPLGHRPGRSLRGGASTGDLLLTASRYAMTGPSGMPDSWYELRLDRVNRYGGLRVSFIEARRKRDAEPRSMPGYG
jgi:hypothetical protein